MSLTGLEKLTNDNRSVSAVNDQLFPVELTEIADWTSMSEYMLHSNFGQTLTRVIGINFGVYTFILPLSSFPEYLSTFLDVRILKQNKNTSEFPQTNLTSPLKWFYSNSVSEVVLLPWLNHRALMCELSKTKTKKN